MLHPPGFHVFYGWYIVLAGAASNIVIFGVTLFGFGTLYEPMRQETGWSMAAITLGVSLRSLERGIFSPFTGFMVDRLGPRRMALAGVAIVVAGLLIISQAHALWHYYVGSGIVSLGSGMSSLAPFGAAIMKWFTKGRSRATGALFAANGLGYFMVPLIAILVGVVGWRDTLVLAAILIAVVAGPLAFVLRGEPALYGLGPDGEAEAESQERAPAWGRPAEPGMTIPEVLRTPAFYVLALAAAAGSIKSIWNIFLVVHLVTVGFSVVTAGFLAAAYGVTQVVFRLASGWLGDRFGRAALYRFGFLLLGVGFAAIAIVSAERLWLLIPGYILFGFGESIWVVISQTITADYFGTKRYATVQGLMSSLVLPVNLAVPLFAGWMFDRTGGYRDVFLIYAILMGTGALWMSFIRRKPLLERGVPRVSAAPLAPVEAAIKKGK